jgi:hypothetical protein
VCLPFEWISVNDTLLRSVWSENCFRSSGALSRKELWQSDEHWERMLQIYLFWVGWRIQGMRDVVTILFTWEYYPSVMQCSVALVHFDLDHILPILFVRVSLYLCCLFSLAPSQVDQIGAALHPLELSHYNRESHWVAMLKAFNEFPSYFMLRYAKV